MEVTSPYLQISEIMAKQSTRCGGPAWRKTCKQNSFYVGVVWQTQSIVKHLAQTKKKWKKINDNSNTEFEYVEYVPRNSKNMNKDGR